MLSGTPARATLIAALVLAGFVLAGASPGPSASPSASLSTSVTSSGETAAPVATAAPSGCRGGTVALASGAGAPPAPSASAEATATRAPGPSASGPSTGSTPAPSSIPVTSSEPATGPGALSVSLVGAVDDSSYPDVCLVLSVVDAANGRPLTQLNPSNVTADPAVGNLTVSASATSLPTAYVLVVDTSGSMVNKTPDGKTTYMERARSLADAFLAELGPDDQVNLITFSDSAHPSGWRASGDKALTDAISAIKKPSGTTHMSAALIAASAAASPAPEGTRRRAIVLITDASSADNDAALTPDQMSSKLGPPTFVVGLAASAIANLQNVVAITGGSYQQADSNTDATALFKPVFDSARSSWTVQFRTDATPDGKSHEQTLGIADAEQRTGNATFSYLAGGLPSVTNIIVDGLKDGAEVSADRTVTFSVGGARSWAHTQLELFVDRDPAKYGPTQTENDGILTWSLAVAPLSQGRHTVVAQLTVTDDHGNRFGPEEVSLSFTRGGTTWNIAAVVLVGGIALLAIGAVFIASRRRLLLGSRRVDR